MNCVIEPISVYAILSCMIFALGILFLLGIANFALHKAVLESGHPFITQMLGEGAPTGFARQWTLLVEFALLLFALWIAGSGALWPVWLYGLYSGLNISSAWMILTGRI